MSPPHHQPAPCRSAPIDHGRPVAVLLHADRWSLVLHAARIRTYGWQPPVTWVFLDRPDDPDRRGLYDEFGVTYLADSFDYVRGADAAEWTHMVTPPCSPSPPRRPAPAAAA